MVAEGLDLLVGVDDDEVFGPVLTIGAGGVATEIERDVAHLAIPFGYEELVSALRTLRLWPRLAGFRGNAGSDLATLGPIVRAIADGYLAQSSSITEIEINPLRVIGEANQTRSTSLHVVA